MTAASVDFGRQGEVTRLASLVFRSALSELNGTAAPAAWLGRLAAGCYSSLEADVSDPSSSLTGALLRTEGWQQRTVRVPGRGVERWWLSAACDLRGVPVKQIGHHLASLHERTPPLAELVERHRRIAHAYI